MFIKRERERAGSAKIYIRYKVDRVRKIRATRTVKIAPCIHLQPADNESEPRASRQMKETREFTLNFVRQPFAGHYYDYMG